MTQRMKLDEILKFRAPSYVDLRDLAMYDGIVMKGLELHEVYGVSREAALIAIIFSLSELNEDVTNRVVNLFNTRLGGETPDVHIEEVKGNADK